jgi:hypothetical protein
MDTDRIMNSALNEVEQNLQQLENKLAVYPNDGWLEEIELILRSTSVKLLEAHHTTPIGLYTTLKQSLITQNKNYC